MRSIKTLKKYTKIFTEIHFHIKFTSNYYLIHLVYTGIYIPHLKKKWKYSIFLTTNITEALQGLPWATLLSKHIIVNHINLLVNFI